MPYSVAIAGASGYAGGEVLPDWEFLESLPGVGHKSAQRMAYHLLQHDRPGAERLAGLRSVPKGFERSKWGQEVLDAVDNLEATWQRILAARQSVVLEARNYRAEQGQFQLGLRNSTDVLDAETRLADARIAQITALTDHQIAQIDLAFATGMLLGATRISW